MAISRFANQLHEADFAGVLMRLPEFWRIRLGGSAQVFKQRYFVLCASALLLAAGACNPGKPALAPVSGRVAFRSQPLSGGFIVFTPDPQRGGRGPLAIGKIERDGHYVLSTDGQPGAVVGWHRITIAAAPSSGDPTFSPALPAHYCDPDQSGQSFEVLPDRVNNHDLNLE
jgi:hypothetical protein